MNKIRLVRHGLVAALALSSALVLAADPGTAAGRQDRMNDAYTNYQNTRPGGVDRSGTSVRRDARNAGHAVGNAARKGGHAVASGARKGGHAVANGARKGGHAIANGTRKAGHAVGTGLRKTGEAIDHGGEKLQSASTPKP